MAEGSKQENGEEFSQRMMDTITAGFSVPSIALAARLGMFDKMAEFSEGKTSQEIADSLGFKERYVRELLGALVCLHIVDYDASTKTYIFPESRHAALVLGPESLSVMAMFIPANLQAYTPVIKCFEKDGPLGVSEEQPEIYKALAESGKRWTPELMERMMKSDEQLMERLKKGISICDIGCSTGNEVLSLASLYPNSTVHGIDIRQDALDTASEAAEARNITNVSFILQDICDTPPDWAEKFDLFIVLDSIHDIPLASKAMANVWASLKPGGQFYILDPFCHSELEQNVNNPMAAICYVYSLFNCLSTSLAVEGSEGLGACWGIEKAETMLKEAGFSSVKQLAGPEEKFMYIMATK